ncbi:MAG: hypothetical protein ABJH26_06375, partial [Marinomonas sp.]
MKAQLMARTALIALSATAITGCATYADDGTANPITAAETATEYAPVIPTGTGYFASDSTLPFLTPDFTKISEDDYMPAFTQGMEIHAAEVDAIINNPAEPTMANTIIALEQSGAMLGRVATVFFALTGANTTDRLDDINKDISPKLSAHSDSITLNPKLFARVKAVYDKRALMAMTAEDSVLLENMYRDMVHAGALLTDAERDSVKAIN